jgi:hypothetical protein
MYSFNSLKSYHYLHYITEETEARGIYINWWVADVEFKLRCSDCKAYALFLPYTVNGEKAKALKSG